MSVCRPLERSWEWQHQCMCFRHFQLPWCSYSQPCLIQWSIWSWLALHSSTTTVIAIVDNLLSKDTRMNFLLGVAALEELYTTGQVSTTFIPKIDRLSQHNQQLGSVFLNPKILLEISILPVISTASWTGGCGYLRFINVVGGSTRRWPSLDEHLLTGWHAVSSSKYMAFLMKESLLSLWILARRRNHNRTWHQICLLVRIGASPLLSSPTLTSIPLWPTL